MFDHLNTIKATKYDTLTKWLQVQLENNKNIKTEDLESLLLSLGIEIKHKIQEIKETENKSQSKTFDNIKLSNKNGNLKEEKKIPEKLELPSFIEFKTMTPEERYVITAKEYDVLKDLIDYLKSKGE